MIVTDAAQSGGRFGGNGSFVGVVVAAAAAKTPTAAMPGQLFLNTHEALQATSAAPSVEWVEDWGMVVDEQVPLALAQGVLLTFGRGEDALAELVPIQFIDANLDVLILVGGVLGVLPVDVEITTAGADRFHLE